MTLIKTLVDVTEDHRISGIVPAGIPAGKHEAIITLVPPPRARIADLPVHPSGWEDRLSLRREDLYGDAGR